MPYLGPAEGEHVEEAPPYPGAEPHLLIGDELDNAMLTAALIRATAADLPTPAPKKPHTPRKKERS